MLPCLTNDGKIVLESKCKVAMAPDGNGGLYGAMADKGMLKDMQDRGVDYLHTICVDNALVKPLDPGFLGYCITSNAQVGSLVCPKSHPDEKVGVLCLKNGKWMVVEYSEIDDVAPEDKVRRDDNGELVFRHGNICNHVYSLDFLVNTVVPNLGNMYHIARKKIGCADENGNTFKPTSNNGIKLEMFIFDVFPLCDPARMCVYEVARSNNFSPVKNAPGPGTTDSPTSALAMVTKLHRSWLEKAGVNVVGEGDVEVSPLLSYQGEGLESLSGSTIQAPAFITLGAGNGNGGLVKLADKFVGGANNYVLFK
jgi:UDP-N-acetylglucosamine/UDP-N-acetylgalactosamine diphosphorylase